MSYSPVGDTVALTTLAYNIYKKVYAVAKNAPEQFRELSQELKIHKVVLFRIRDQIKRDTGSEYSQSVKDVLESCFQTLRGVRDLTAKYENLGWSDKGVWSKRLQWAKDQNAIQDFRTKFNYDQQRLQLILTADGRQQLDLLLRQRSDEKAHDSPLLRQDTRTAGGRAPGHDESCTCGIQPVRRFATNTTTDSRTLFNPRDEYSLASPELGGARSPDSHKRTFSSTAPTGLGTETLQSLVLAQRSQSITTFESRYSGSGASFDRAQPSTIATGISVGTDISEETTISSPPTTKEPLILPPERAKHDASPALNAAFADGLNPLRELYSTQEWLRLAIWWLVKSRILCKLLAQNGAQRRGTDASLHDYNWESTISSHQAYLDLLKCSWILEEIVLGTDTEKDLANKNIRRLVKDLTRSLDRDLRRRRASNPEFPTFEDEVLLKQDLSLIESFEQTVEAKDNVPNAMDDLAHAHRWLEVDNDNAGLPHERVKFRTFVNAQIGSRNDRSKSSSAPYMLLLWTTVDESDLLVSLCNQQGTVNLSRALFRSDLEAYENVDETTPFVIDFPSQEAEVMFLTAQDVSDFAELPRQFFQAMKTREPHPGELAIFQAAISSYSESSSRWQLGEKQIPTMSASKTSSCGLRLYESVSDKCSRITRRLVISSAPDITDSRCVSHWLPLDYVRVAVEETKATVSWSDCGQLQETGDGKFGVHYAYKYKPEEPNRKIHLEFRNATDAYEFSQRLLYPTEMPPQLSTKLNIPYAFQNLRTYRLFDVDEPSKGYHAIASTTKSPQGPHMTSLYYIYRDYDWILATKPDSPTPSIIEFPSLTTSHHISTVPRLQYKPTPTDPIPTFSHACETSRAAHLELGCDHDLIRFMHSLTGWTLKYYRLLPKLVLIDTSPLIRNNKQAFKRIGCQLWEKASEEGQSRTQLAVRLEGGGRERWITAGLEENMSYGSEYHTIEVRGLDVKRGEEMDSKYMMAIRRGEEGQGVGRKVWRVQMTFEGANDKDEFMRMSGLITT